ncbi:tyrosinase family protein [Bacillus sp. FSL R9-9410]|uniref:tyrosinase family protein n=1 Tax=Bacillus sp. FSL R9-9410 TaxID=2921590 RepID=UPI0031019FAB
MDKVGRELEALITSSNFMKEERFENITVTTKKTVQIIRKDQKNFNDEEKTAFKNAVNKLIRDGIYKSTIEIHADMSHNMHTMNDNPNGTLRFLSWHRRYLLAFEEALQKADRTLRPQAQTLVTIPYWRWVDPFPAWLQGFLPAQDPQTGNSVPPRTLSGSSLKPSSSDVDFIINDFRQQLPILNLDDYSRFTIGLEGNGQKLDGSDLPAHNQVHAWVGGIMDNIQYSPTDPFFWLHHAEVDRLWHIWQQKNPGIYPALIGGNRIMDPWQESSDQLASIAVLGYSYENESL